MVQLRAIPMSSRAQLAPERLPVTWRLSGHKHIHVSYNNQATPPKLVDRTLTRQSAELCRASVGSRSWGKTLSARLVAPQCRPERQLLCLSIKVVVVLQGITLGRQVLVEDALRAADDKAASQGSKLEQVATRSEDASARRVCVWLTITVTSLERWVPSC